MDTPGDAQPMTIIHHAGLQANHCRVAASSNRTAAGSNRIETTRMKFRSTSWSPAPIDFARYRIGPRSASAIFSSPSILAFSIFSSARALFARSRWVASSARLRRPGASPAPHIRRPPSREPRCDLPSRWAAMGAILASASRLASIGARQVPTGAM
jgi:hypothetical protein